MRKKLVVMLKLIMMSFDTALIVLIIYVFDNIILLCKYKELIPDQ